MTPARDVLDNPMLAAAVESARHELPVYPARVRGKAPLYKGWQQSATSNPEFLVKVWRRAPRANIGIACRNITVLDADSDRGVDAVEELGLPATTTVRTARGCHYYFLGRRPTVARLLPDVEVRGVGSGILGAGSVHPTGFEYAWEIPPWEIPPVAVPPQLGQLLDRRSVARAGDTRGFVFEGGRHVHLLRVAGSLRGRYGVSELMPVLEAINDVQCRPPLAREQVKKIARDADKYPYPPTWLADPLAFCDDPRLGTTSRLVLLLLANHADSEGRCFPGIRRLAQLSNSSPNTILKAIKELEEAGRIKVDRRRSGNRYQILSVPGGRSSVSVIETAQGTPAPAGTQFRPMPAAR